MRMFERKRGEWQEGIKILYNGSNTSDIIDLLAVCCYKY
jgi:hypothetical protein